MRSVALADVQITISMGPGILAAAVMIFGFSWSEFLFPLILTASPKAQTFTVGLNGWPNRSANFGQKGSFATCQTFL